MVYGRYNYSFHGVYEPTNITGGHHPVWTIKSDGFPVVFSMAFPTKKKKKRHTPNRGPRLERFGVLGVPCKVLREQGLQPWQSLVVQFLMMGIMMANDG